MAGGKVLGPEWLGTGRRGMPVSTLLHWGWYPHCYPSTGVRSILSYYIDPRLYLNLNHRMRMSPAPLCCSQAPTWWRWWRRRSQGGWRRLTWTLAGEEAGWRPLSTTWSTSRGGHQPRPELHSPCWGSTPGQTSSQMAGGLQPWMRRHWSHLFWVQRLFYLLLRSDAIWIQGLGGVGDPLSDTN